MIAASTEAQTMSMLTVSGPILVGLTGWSPTVILPAAYNMLTAPLLGRR